MDYWVFIVRPEWWDDLKPPANWWVFRRSYPKLKKGDKGVVYVARKGVFSTAFEILENQRSNATSRVFPYRADLRHFFDLKEDDYIKVLEHRSNLTLLKDKGKNWGSAFQKSILSLPKEDFQYLYELMGKKAENYCN